MSLLPVGFGASGGDYEITDSLRIRNSASASLQRFNATETNRRTFTYSGWFKLGYLNNDYWFQSARYNTSNFTGITINVNQGFGIYQKDSNNITFVVREAGEKRDYAAWYHFVAAVDTTQSTSTNRVKLYVNGVLSTSLVSASYPSQNLDTFFNTTTAVQTFAQSATTGNAQWDGYVTETHFIDGQALTADDFGEYDDNGTWKPLAYTGTYGTNGFYLPMDETRDSIVTDYLVIAGGGSGGSRAGGGGGAGGYLTGTAYLKPSTTYTITVGAGGAAVVSIPSARGNNGTNSVLSGTRISTITSIGGGAGGVYPGSTSLVATTGGSGGGGGSVLGSTSGAGAAGTTSQGNAGGDGASDAYHGGGGGGAGSAGSNGSASVGGAGGSGSASSITGSSITRAGGGGGSPSGSASGGGGAGGAFANGNATAGTVNTGGGGGGARNASDTTNVYSGAGGSGVVILRLLTSEYSSTTTGSPTVTTDGSYTILTYTSSGTYTT